MNPNDVKKLQAFVDYETAVKNCSTAKSLDELRDLYLVKEAVLGDLYDELDTLSNGEDTIFESFDELETVLLRETVIPTFSHDNEEFKIYELHNDNEVYFHRYGCTMPEYIVSYDDNAVLFDNYEDDNGIKIIPRPDALLHAS